MKKFFRTGFMTAFAVILTSGWCFAATIMFPYVNSNPGNLSTIVNVINTATLAGVGCAATEDLQLHYRYMTKEVTADAIDACEERDFYRPTTTDDLVTFDAGGHINNGEAMFNDATDYNIGAGAPALDLPNMGLTEPRRGYLLVTHACSVTGEAVTGILGAGLLDGEVMLLDVVNGAAWGYQAVLADQNALGNYAFAACGLGAGANPIAGATTELLVENDAGSAQIAQPNVAIYPPDEFQTRFFVTPLILNTDAAALGTNDMSQTLPANQKRTRIQLLNAAGLSGVTDRDENLASGGGPVHVRCVAGVDLNDLTGGGFGPWYDAQGGWATVNLLGPVSLAGDAINADDYAAVVYKLQFGSPSFASGMINSISIVRTDRIQ